MSDRVEKNGISWEDTDNYSRNAEIQQVDNSVVDHLLSASNEIWQIHIRREISCETVGFELSNFRANFVKFVVRLTNISVDNTDQEVTLRLLSILNCARVSMCLSV